MLATQESSDGSDEEDKTAEKTLKEDDTNKDALPKSETKDTEGGSKVTGKTVYISPDKPKLTTPLLLLLIGMLVIVVVLQIQYLQQKRAKLD